MNTDTVQTLRDELRAVPAIVGQAPEFDWASAPDAPYELFLSWLRYALEIGVPEAHAATLSTVDADGLPNARMLIVKDITDDCGFSFATSDESAKGRELAGNPGCALTFYWSPLARAVRVRGIAQRASAAEAAQDFLARHPRARAIVLAAQQSSVISENDAHDERLADAMAAMEVDDTKVSPHWVVWTVVPSSIEFWQGDPSRNHQRLRYVRAGQAWDKQRLWP